VEFLALLGAQGTVYTLGWLEEQIAFNQRITENLNRLPGSAIYLGTPLPAWAIVFEVSCDNKGFPTDSITQETVEICQKLWRLSLSVDMRLSVDRKEVIILVGIPYAIMQEEAETMRLQMRLRMTRGTMAYEQLHHAQFRTYHISTRYQSQSTEAQSYDTTFLSAHHQSAISNRLTRNGMDLWFRMRLPDPHSLLKRQRKVANHKVPHSLVAVHFY